MESDFNGRRSCSKKNKRSSSSNSFEGRPKPSPSALLAESFTVWCIKWYINWNVELRSRSTFKWRRKNMSSSLQRWSFKKSCRTLSRCTWFIWWFGCRRFAGRDRISWEEECKGYQWKTARIWFGYKSKRLTRGLDSNRSSIKAASATDQHQT